MPFIFCCSEMRSTHRKPRLYRRRFSSPEQLPVPGALNAYKPTLHIFILIIAFAPFFVNVFSLRKLLFTPFQQLAKSI